MEYIVASKKPVMAPNFNAFITFLGPFLIYA